ncbi:MAG: hypothetical protein F4187_08755 [Gemmatimonadetes bacterium]|nr:hypothetical protein [Gemmatimonadota bacterium]MYI07534.1 hypothetical protein [Gemmatimonadota bacterium]
MFRAVSAGRPGHSGERAPLVAQPPARQGFVPRVLGRGLVVALALQPAIAAVQEPDCRLVRVGGHTRSMRSVFASGPATYRHYASGGVDYRCSDGTRVLADSAIVYESDNQVQLYGSVVFQDPETELRADSAFYFSNLRRLHAWSNVQVTDRISDAVIEGDFLTYDQASEFRALDLIMVEGGEPHATFFVAPTAPAPPEEPPEADSGQVVAEPPEADSGQVEAEPPEADSGQAPAGEEADAEPADTLPPVPWEVDADRFQLEGRRYFRAFGQVEIRRDSLTAFGDSLRYDQEVGEMVVTGGARFEGQAYTLVGVSVSVTPAGPRSEVVLARENARLSGEQMEMAAPAIRLFVDGGNVDRIVALPDVPPQPGGDDEIDTSGLSPGDAERLRALSRTQEEETETEPPEDSLPRPVVLARDFQLSGDSIAVFSPDQRLDSVVSVGDARAQGVGQDTLRGADLPEALRQDWLTGDRIVARFGRGESGDTTGRLETLTATGNARSFYRVFPEDTAEVGTDRRPALHLVSGAEITIHLEGQEVVGMDVDGETEGWHFDPLPAAPDSLASDTMRTNPDSMVPPDTVRPPDTLRVSGPPPHRATTSAVPAGSGTRAWVRRPKAPVPKRRFPATLA